jgi:hypothetical protein
MFNKPTTAVLYAAVISSMVVASVFAIIYIQQQALAQGIQTADGGAPPANKTSGAAGSNRSTNATGGGTAAGGNNTGIGGGP